MKGFGVLSLFLALILVVTANDCPVRSYTTKLIPACDTKDLRIKWPNYENQSSYYRCQTVNHAVLVSCTIGEVFVYVYQKCKPCSDYLPPIECALLPTQNAPNCAPIDDTNSSGTTAATPLTPFTNYPTPHYPSSAFPSNTTIPPINNGTTVFPESTEISSSGQTTDNGNENNTESTVTVATSETTFPPPPHEPTQPSNPNLPTPPIVDPTPPTVNPTPPEDRKF